jgi:hypothetical protein
VTIDINNKMLELNNKLVKLTNKSLDENATVRIVTLVTLIYLPASFVSVSPTDSTISMLHFPDWPWYCYRPSSA